MGQRFGERDGRRAAYDGNRINPRKAPPIIPDQGLEVTAQVPVRQMLRELRATPISAPKTAPMSFLKIMPDFAPSSLGGSRSAVQRL